MINYSLKLGKYLTLKDFCTCSQTYKKYADKIDPLPKSLETIQALQALNQWIIDPIIDHFDYNNFQLTYGFCSPDLKKYLNQKDPETGIKNGRIDPARDQHLAHEKNRNNKYFCQRLGASCDFLIKTVPSNQVIDWILAQPLPFDSLYYYGSDRPIHISYGSQHKRDIWTFTPKKTPTKKGIEHWVKLVNSYSVNS
ncbi:MAG: hypothetical protein AB4041_13580 [Microcystaceae cyanobacterium]